MLSHLFSRQSLQKLCFVLFLTFSINAVAADAKEPPTRLIVGSGNMVKHTYPMARNVTTRDITIDIEHHGSDRFLRPTHVLDISRLATVRFLAKQYPQKFDMIIFEHVGDGLASFTHSNKELDEILKLYHSMLKPGGQLQYEGYRYSITFLNNNLRVDHSVPTGNVDTCFQVLKHDSMEPAYNAFGRFNSLVQFYDNIFKKTQFQNVSVKLKVDPTYRRYYPSPYPYYYLEIQAKKI